MIEKALGITLLSRKILFETTLRFITYGYEGARKNDRSVIANYLINYPQMKLTEEQKEVLIKYANDIKTTVDHMLSSLYLLLNFILKKNYSGIDSIADVLSNLPQTQAIDLKCYQFFNTHNSFKLNQSIKYSSILSIFAIQVFSVI